MVFVIVVYDVEAARTSLFLKFLRQYLVHVQNSVFEGEVTEGQAEEVEAQLSVMMKSGESVILYRASGPSLIDRKVFGDDPREDERLL